MAETTTTERPPVCYRPAALAPGLTAYGVYSEHSGECLGIRIDGLDAEGRPIKLSLPVGIVRTLARWADSVLEVAER